MAKEEAGERTLTPKAEGVKLLAEKTVRGSEVFEGSAAQPQPRMRAWAGATCAAPGAGFAASLSPAFRGAYSAR